MKSSFARPYVGVTGYTSHAQVEAVHAAAAHLPSNGRILMDGYLLWADQVSTKWRSDGNAPANYSARFLSVEEGHRIFRAQPDGSLRLIHLRTNVHRQLDEQFQDCLDTFGPGIDGFQINWVNQPDARELADFRATENAKRAHEGRGEIAIVLQLHPSVISHLANGDALVRYVAPYVESDGITHVLYDPSGGEGRGFQTYSVIRAVSSLRKEFPGLHLGVAGGLSPDNIQAKVQPIWKSDPLVSIDVEGRVRDPVSDHLDLRKTIGYVSAAFQLSHSLQAHPPAQIDS